MSKEFFLPEVEELSLTLGTMDGANFGSGYKPGTPDKPDDPTPPIIPPSETKVEEHNSGGHSVFSFGFGKEIPGDVKSITIVVKFKKDACMYSSAMESLRVVSCPNGGTIVPLKTGNDNEWQIMYTKSDNENWHTSRRDFCKIECTFNNNGAVKLNGNGSPSDVLIKALEKGNFSSNSGAVVPIGSDVSRYFDVYLKEGK